MRTVLYVCTGNTCRSPMAEAIARHVLDQRLIDDPSTVLVASAGVAAIDGLPPSPDALGALTALGIEHQGRSKPLTAEMIRRADVVFCMTTWHVEQACRLVDDEPAHTRKIVRLNPAGDLEDPIGSGRQAYDELAARLTGMVPQRLKEMLADEDLARIGSSG